jgi:DnaJ domain
MANTLYDILEVIPTASPETIHAAYRSLISRYHPDRMAGLGSEFQVIADARTKEINHAYDVLGDASRRAIYDEELRAQESLPPDPKAQVSGEKRAAVTHRTSGAAPVNEVGGEKRGWRLLAALLAAFAGIALLLTLPAAANAIFGTVELSVTGHARYFQDFENPIDARGAYSGVGYLLILWGWLFVNYVFGLFSYRLAVRVGEEAASRAGESFAGTNDRLFLFLTFVCVIAGVELFLSAHTMGNMLTDMFLLAGAYLAERGFS